MRVFLKSNTKNPFKYMFSYLEAQTEGFVQDLLIQRLDLASKMAKYLYVKSKYVSVHTVQLSKTLQNPNQNVYLNLFPPSRTPKKEMQQNSNCNTSAGFFFHDGWSQKKSCFQHIFYKKQNSQLILVHGVFPWKSAAPVNLGFYLCSLLPVCL